MQIIHRFIHVTANRIPILFLYLHLTYFFLPNCGLTQDLHWLIRDHYIRNSTEGTNPSYVYTNQLLNTLSIENISQPQEPYINNAGQHVIPRREFFIIFDDGRFGKYTDNNSSIISNYHYNGKRIQYMYVTYIYDDDLPKKFSIVPHGTGSATSRNVLATHYDSIVNHDIVDGEDIIVIGHKYLNLGSGWIKPNKICYEFEDPNVAIDSLELLPSPLYPNFINNGNQPENAFITKITTPYHMVKTFYSDGNGTNRRCIDMETVDTSANEFYNFKCIAQPSTYGKVVKFIAINTDSNFSKIQRIHVNKESHDPNFFEVQCLWKENGEYWGRFHVECFNEGDSSVHELALSMFLPEAIDISSIRLDSFAIGCNKGRGSPLTWSDSLNDRNVKFNFPGELWNITPINDFVEVDSNISEDPGVMSAFDEYSLATCNYTAWLEFCARIDIDANSGQTIHNISLQPSEPQMYFDQDTYPIFKFIDQFRCVHEKCWPCYTQQIFKPRIGWDTAYVANMRFSDSIKIKAAFNSMDTAYIGNSIQSQEQYIHDEYCYCVKKERIVSDSCEPCELAENNGDSSNILNKLKNWFRGLFNSP